MILIVCDIVYVYINMYTLYFAIYIVSEYMSELIVVYIMYISILLFISVRGQNYDWQIYSPIVVIITYTSIQ